MGIEWTKEQKRAISYKQNRELLISAAAGAGKTTVMVERVLQACFSRGISPEEFIILTFTDKAAANMKKKLEVELVKKVRAAEEPADKARWQAIQKELPLAQVSTIHSFCLRLIKEYKHLLVDCEGELYYPQDLRTIDEYESKILQEEALDGLIGEIYNYFLDPETRKAAAAREWPALFLDEGISEEEWFADFLAMQRLRGRQKDDRGFREEIKAGYGFLRSLPNYEAWCREAFNRLIAEEQDFVNSPACRYFLQELEAYVFEAESVFFNLENHPYYAEIYKQEKNKSQEKERFIDLYPKLKDFVAAYRTRRPAGSPIDTLSPEDRSAIWDACADFNHKFPRWDLFRKDTRNPVKTEYRDLFASRLGPLLQYLQGGYEKKSYKEFGIAQIKSPFLLTMEEIKAYSAKMFPLLARFLEVLFLFDRRYLALKREKNALDFSDYEHLALEIVRLPGVSDILSRSYREIIVDEYQDTSPLQEALLQALQTDRISMLGDIKQSIYLFRHANPNIFNKKLKHFVDSTYQDPGGESPEGETILLNKNFRSRASLLGFINDFFASFLREETGEIDYDESQRLIAGFPDEAFPQARAAVSPCSFVYCFEKKDSPQRTGLSPAQAALLSGLAKLLAQGFAPEEVAILTRTKKLALEAQETLEMQGIASQLNLEKEFLNSRELRLLKALVELLANFAQDLPLVAVLRSEFGGQAFTETELFQLANFSLEGERLAHFYEEEETRRSFFYERFLAYAKTGPDEKLREKAAAFLETYATWRKQATFLSLHDLLRRIIEESSWLDSLSGQVQGRDRLADVDKFLEAADRYGKNNPQDFSGFARYLEEIQKHEVKFKEEDDGQVAAGLVNIMTMHGSKGLEFPAVIYYEASHQKKAESLSDPRIFSVEEGLAANYPDESYDLLAPRSLYFYMARDFRDRAEAYRLLYVAMTRAEEALCITGSPGRASEEKLKELGALASKARASQEAGRFDSRFIADLKTDFDLLFSFLSLSFPDLLHIEEEAKKAEGLCLEKGACSLCFKELSAMEADFHEDYGRYLADKKERERREGAEDSEGLGKEGLPDFSEPRELLAVDEKETNRSSEATILLADAFAFPESKKAKESLRKLLQDSLPGDEKLFIPGKVTVSELKGRLMKDGGHDGGSPLEPLMEMALSLREVPAEAGGQGGQEGLSPTEYGTFLHRLFERLDVVSYFNQAGDCQEEAAARTIYEARVRESVAERVFAPEEEAGALEAFPLVYSFLQSSLAKKLFIAERKGAFVGRELPFTLAVPAIGLAEPGEDISLVQGMIDLFFDSDEGTILVDYKSDRLYGTKEEREACLLRRYQVQMDYYALAIERLRGRQVTESYIWLIREGRAVPMAKTETSFMFDA